MHISLKSILFGLSFHILKAKNIDELMLPYKSGPFKVREVSYGGIFNLELDQHYVKVWVPEVPGTFPVVYHLTGLAGLNSSYDLLMYILRAQSFTSLKADLRQDINGGFTFSRCLNGTFP